MVYNVLNKKNLLIAERISALKADYKKLEKLITPELLDVLELELLIDLKNYKNLMLV